MDLDEFLGGSDVQYDEDTDVDIARLPSSDREAILSRVTPDDSKPTDAFTLAQNEIRREMLDRGLQPKGFFNDDAATLQEEFNREHLAESHARQHRKQQAAARSYLKETVQRRRQEREQELKEEVSELSNNPELEVWLGLVQQQRTPMNAELKLNGVATRALCKRLQFNHSLVSLSLCGNKLRHDAGKWLATLLSRNSTLQRLELEGNEFGSSTAKELAMALRKNKTLLLLNLESNPLTDDEKDFSGVLALGEMLAVNSTLRSLSLWRTRLGVEGGRHIANSISKNETLISLDVGNNRLAVDDERHIRAQIVRNQQRFDELQEKKVVLRKAHLTAAAKEQARHDLALKQVEEEHWIEERKQERHVERMKQEQERQRLMKEEEDRLRQVSDRKALEFAVKLEMEKKKKSKKGGKKK